MVLITSAAQAQLEALENHYAGLGRDLATIRLTQAIATAATRIEEQIGPFFPAPRPYPGLTSYGWQWLKASQYWIAFSLISDHYTITAVFFETANIPSRLARYLLS